MKKLMILTVLTIAMAGFAVQRASAGVVVRATLGVPVPGVFVGGAYATPAYVAPYPYTPIYSPAPAYPASLYAPPVVYATPPAPVVVLRPPVVVSAPILGIGFGPFFHSHDFHHHHH